MVRVALEGYKIKDKRSGNGIRMGYKRNKVRERSLMDTGLRKWEMNLIT